MLDMLDLVELVVDFGCIVAYSNPFMIALFYLAIGMSIIMATTNRGLEQSNTDDEKKSGFDTMVTAINILFNDALFLVLRMYVMTKSVSIEGLVFVVKEVMSMILRISLLCCKSEN